ncbi:hypothetical protein V5O48_018072, partial [Marasmius crinis-equi]
MNCEDGTNQYHHKTSGEADIPMYHPIPSQLPRIPSPMFSDALPLSPTVPIPPSSYTPPTHPQGAGVSHEPENEIPAPGPSRRQPSRRSSRTDAHHDPYPKRRPHSHLQVESSDDDEELGDLPHNATDQQRIEYRRRSNALATRRSRRRKELYRQELEQLVNQLTTAQTEMCKTRAESRMGIVTSLGDLPPDATDQEKIEYKRHSNAFAAHRSRKRKEVYRQELEFMVEQLTMEAEKWKSLAEMGMVPSVDDSTLRKQERTFMDSESSNERPSKRITTEEPRPAEQQLRGGGDFLGLMRDHNEMRLMQLEKILNDAEQQKALLQSKGDDAQAWLDLLQLLGDYPSISTRLRSTVFSVMIRLAKNSGLHPKCLSIQNVKKVGDHP